MVALERSLRRSPRLVRGRHCAPAKFETVVEPLIQQCIGVPHALQNLLNRPAHAEPLLPELNALETALKNSAEFDENRSRI